MEQKLKVTWLKDGKMPEPPATRGNKVIISVEEAEARVLTVDPTRFGWKMDENGAYNPSKGRIQRKLVCDCDEQGNPVRVAYDIAGWYDGKTNPEGGYFPTEIVAPILRAPADPEDPSSPIINWVLFYWEWRPSMERWVASVPGGFEPAKEEALEEAGLVILGMDYILINFNRANVLTMVRVGYSFVGIGADPIPEKLESIFSGARYAIPLSKFKMGPDAHVNMAVGFARQELEEQI